MKKEPIESLASCSAHYKRNQANATETKIQRKRDMHHFIAGLTVGYAFLSSTHTNFQTRRVPSSITKQLVTSQVPWSANYYFPRKATAIGSASCFPQTSPPTSQLPMPDQPTSGARQRGRDDTVSDDTTPSYVAHNAPKSTYLILNSPAISSFVLVKGWKGEESLKSFKDAVNTVVSNNPVLTGRATCPDDWWKDPIINIKTGEFVPGESGHEFVQTIDKRNGLPIIADEASTPDHLTYIDRHIAPVVGKLDFTLQHIHNKSPLFEAKVVLLPNDYACIYTKMSHCIGDLVTYYEILDQISSIDKGKKDLHLINWNNPLKAKHEIFPEELSQRDFRRLYGIPFLIGIASHVPFMPLRKKEYLFLNKDKIMEEKAKYNANGIRGITSNEIITAALCDANRSTDIFAMTRSMRGISRGLDLRDGGNLHCEIPFSRCAGRNPLVIKDILEKGRYYEPNEVPIWEALTGRVGRISNCVAPIQRMSFGGGCKPLCYCPSKSFLNFTPFDTAVIFRACDGQVAIMHNFANVEKNSKLYKELLVPK